MGDQKTIFITGSTGFIGRAVLDELVSRNYAVRALVRSKRSATSQVTYLAGDLFDQQLLDRGMKDVSAVIHLVGIIREKKSAGQTFERIHHQGTISIIDAARRNGVRRFLHMSALGSEPDSRSEYALTKYQAEQYLKKTDLDYTIFRPSLVIGKSGEFTEMLRAWASYRKVPWLFMPYFGKGLLGQRSALVQPIRVDDVANAFAGAVERSDLSGKTIDLVGPEQMDWREMYRRAAIAMVGEKRLSIGLPIWYARLLTQICPSFLLPFNRAQIELAAIDNVSDLSKMQSLLNWSPKPIRFE